MLTPELRDLDLLRKIRMVVMDIDGTLVDPGRNNFNNVLGYLWKLRRLGIGFTLATGRTYHGALATARNLETVRMKTRAMIIYNGAVVLSGGERTVMVRHALEPGAAATVIGRFRELGYVTLAYACDPGFDLTPHEIVYTEGEGGPAQEFNGMPVINVPDLTKLKSEFVAILGLVPDAAEGLRLTNELADTFKGVVRVTTSSGRYIEVSPLKGTKSHAIHELAKLSKISVEEVMAIGDNYNDLEMLEAAGVGVAVENAPDEVKSHATFQCTHPSAAGVVEVLRLLTQSQGSIASTFGME